MQKIKKGDRVAVIAGKDVGEQGEVLAVFPKKDKVVVDGLNIAKRHDKAKPGPGGQQIPAAIREISAPLHISNVQLVCPSCGQRTRVGFRLNAAGEKMRFCKKCNSEFK